MLKIIFEYTLSVNIHSTVHSVNKCITILSSGSVNNNTILFTYSISGGV